MILLEDFFFYGFLLFLGSVGVYLVARLITAAFFKSKKDYEDR